ncbi:MAG: TRAP transporter large permease subunit [Nannocystaceae bacterium]
MAADGGRGRLPANLATFATLLLLASLLVQWTGTQLGSQMVALGERLWPGYAVELREEPTPPVEPSVAEAAAKAEAAAAKTDDDALNDDLLGDLEEGAAAPADSAKEKAAGDGGAEDDLLDDLLADVPGAKSEAELAAEKRAAALADYEQERVAYDSAVARRTAAVKAFAAVDLGLLAIFTWLSGHFGPIFIILLGIGGAVATAGRHHISLRPIRGRRSDRAAQGASLVANLLLIASVVANQRSRAAAGTGGDAAGLESGLWIAAFAVMALINVVHLARPRDGEGDGDGEVGSLRALLSVPLYVTMALISGAYFLVAEGYVAGLAVYLEKLLGNVQLYLQVGLYIWVGMLLKRTRLASLAFAVVRPWRLPPELLAIVVVILAAVPTAYSGASGIFVIAAGALIFRELAAAGARPSLALASTAMSGSMGVVLSPCLLVVIISYLSPVRSDELFEWGRWVFLLSAGLFALIVLLTRQGPLRPSPRADAWPRSGAALRGLLPHVVIFAAVLLVARLLFKIGLDVTSAAFLLPLALLPMLAYDRRHRRRAAATGDEADEGPLAPAPGDSTAFAATAETTTHVGALLLLMALSVCLGGVIERADVVALFPDAFTSPFAGMGALMVVLVLIGMVMDPYGAVILVQATLTGAAVASGIDLLHFWMVVLVAFELGYLTPPVALNHLLARQVIGDAAEASASAAEAGASLWRRHERYLLPITVMALTLVLVAFVPLLLR